MFLDNHGLATNPVFPLLGDIPLTTPHQVRMVQGGLTPWTETAWLCLCLQEPGQSPTVFSQWSQSVHGVFKMANADTGVILLAVKGTGFMLTAERVLHLGSQAALP